MIVSCSSVSVYEQLTPNQETHCEICDWLNKLAWLIDWPAFQVDFGSLLREVEEQVRQVTSRKHFQRESIGALVEIRNMLQKIY